MQIPEILTKSNLKAYAKEISKQASIRARVPWKIIHDSQNGLALQIKDECSN